MKAQISFVEFLTSMIIFIAFVGYFSIQILMFVPNYINQIKSERLRSEAFQISELLINDPGQPLDWNLNFANAKRIGFSDQLSNKTNLLSGAKISVFNTKCQENYGNVKNLMGIDHDFSLILIDANTGGLEIRNCRPATATIRQVNTTIRRVVAYDDGGVVKYGELILQVW